MTPAEHREQAAKDAAQLRNYRPRDPEYSALAQSALYHVLAAIEQHLEPPPAPGIPGLPDGWTVDVSQAMTGNRKWLYVVTGPDGRAWPPAKAQWERPETALAAGIRFAREAAAGTEG